MEKHFENQKLVEQMLTRNGGKTLSLYSTAHLISDCIINKKKLYGPIICNSGHQPWP